MGSTPSQRLFSRITRGAIVASDGMLQLCIQDDMWGRKIAKQQVIQSQGYDRGRRDLPPLRLGELVLLQDVRAMKTRWSTGRCLDQFSDRSYMYMVDVDGEILRRNHRFLKPSILQPMGHEETLEENSKDCELEKGKVTEITRKAL